MMNRTERWTLVPEGTLWAITGTDHVLRPAPDAEYAPSALAARMWAGEILKNEGQMTRPPEWTVRSDNRGTYYEPSVTPDDLNGGGVRTLGDESTDRAEQLREQISSKVFVTLDHEQFVTLVRTGQVELRAVDTTSRMVTITLNWVS